MGKEKRKAVQSGPEPERVKIKESWEKAVRKALKKKRPKGGWPDEKKQPVDK